MNHYLSQKNGVDFEHNFTVNTHVSFDLPTSVMALFDVFTDAGFELFAVGGCIRNLLLNRNPKDWDFTTNATTEQMKIVCEEKSIKWIGTGEAYGTLSLFIENEIFEVTTYRIEGRYLGRAPERVTFTPNLIEDLKRRDFTMNALAYHPEIGIVDPFKGCFDIQSRIVRLIGSEERFQEDPLRLLRGIRFVAELGFNMEPGTIQAVVKCKDTLRSISWERITQELDRLLIAQNVTEGLELLRITGVCSVIIPELQQSFEFDQRHPKHALTLWEHLLAVTAATESDIVTRWAALLHDLGKVQAQVMQPDGSATYYGHDQASCVIAKTILHRLKHAIKVDEQILELIDCHMRLIEPLSKKGFKRLLNQIGEAQCRRLIDLSGADQFAGGKGFNESSRLEFEHYYNVLHEEIMIHSEPINICDMAINGQDLIEAGYPQGPVIGVLKAMCLEYILECPEANEKEKLLQYLKSIEESGKLF